MLAVDGDNQEALIILILALTDQFAAEGCEMETARALLPRLQGEYRRAYYEGIIAERRAKKLLQLRPPGTDAIVYEALREAMAHYEEAERLRAPGEDDPLLRWNSCVRILMKHEEVRRMSLEPRMEDPLE